MRVHVGCGPKILPGFKHADIKKYDHIDYCCDVFNLLDHIQPNSVDEIYACHVVEHVSRHKISELLDVFYTLLKPNGILRVSVPDIEKVVDLYKSGAYPLYPTLYGQFWGGQKDQYDYHTCGFDFKTLETLSMRAGFCDLQRYEWRDFLPEGYDDYSRSYLPHMDFDNGTLLCLNVTMRKQRPLLVFCSGGFTNAINSVIASCVFAKQHNLKMFVHWVEGYIALDIHIRDVFDVNEDIVTIVDEPGFERMLKQAGKALIISHNKAVPAVSPATATRINPKPLATLTPPNIADYNLVFFHTDALPVFANTNIKHHFDEFFKIMTFKKSITEAAAEIYKSFGSSPPQVGLHLRGTDILSHSKKTVNDIVQHANNVAKRIGKPILVCTDDRAIYESISKDPTKFVIIKHRSYVSKRSESTSWYESSSEDHINCNKMLHDGKTFKQFCSSNVYRPTDQIIAAVIDLLLLSKMQQLESYTLTSSISTYFSFAKLLQNYTHAHHIDFFSRK